MPRDAAALAWMANLACLELHPHPVRADDLDHPDELRVDLDPVPGVDVGRRSARWRSVVEATLADFGLVGWPKTSGSRGMHVIRAHRAALELRRGAARGAGAGARGRAARARRSPPASGGRRSATACSSTTTRTPRTAPSRRPTRCGRRRDARVSAPLDWDEVDSCEPGDFTLATMPARFAELGDRHAGIDDVAGSLEPLLELSARQERRGWATRPGRRTTGSRRASRRACSRRKAPRAEASADRDRPRAAQGGRAGRARALEGAPSRGGGAPGAGGRAGRLDARPLVDLDAHPGQPAARAGGAAAGSGAAGSGRGTRPRRPSQLVGRRDLELVVAAVAGRLVRPPAQEDRRVAEAVALQVVVLHLAHALDPQRLPGQVLAGAPAALRRPASALDALASRLAPSRATDGPSSASSRSGASSCTSSLRLAIVNDDVTPTCCSTPASS